MASKSDIDSVLIHDVDEREGSILELCNAKEEPSSVGTGECIRTRILPSFEGEVSKEISNPLSPRNAPSTNSNLRVFVVEDDVLLPSPFRSSVSRSMKAALSE